MFESQHDWFEHEVNFHRKLWECKLCTDRLPRSKPELNSHLEDHHSGTDESIDPQKVESWQKPRIDATECPLCCAFAGKLKAANDSRKCDVTLKQFQSHLGGHFEQLAFAAIPNDVGDVAETTEDLSSDDEYSDKIDSVLDNDESSLASMQHSGYGGYPATKATEEAEKAAAIAELQRVKADAIEEVEKMMEEERKVLLKDTEAFSSDKKKPIRFKDAVGRKFSFPFHLCANWAVSMIWYTLRNVTNFSDRGWKS